MDSMTIFQDVAKSLLAQKKFFLTLLWLAKWLNHKILLILPPPDGVDEFPAYPGLLTWAKWT